MLWGMMRAPTVPTARGRAALGNRGMTSPESNLTNQVNMACGHQCVVSTLCPGTCDQLSMLHVFYFCAAETSIQQDAAELINASMCRRLFDVAKMQVQRQ